LLFDKWVIVVRRDRELLFQPGMAGGLSWQDVDDGSSKGASVWVQFVACLNGGLAAMTIAAIADQIGLSCMPCVNHLGQEKEEAVKISRDLANSASCLDAG